MTLGDFAERWRQSTRLALDFGAEAIALYTEEPEGWRLMGAAALADAAFQDQIRALSEQATKTVGGARVTLWLPEDQILNSSLALEAANPLTRRRIARRILADRTGVSPDEFVFDIAEDATGMWSAAAVERTVANEAAAYARRWGFHPVRISTRHAGAAFADGPDFSPHAAKRRAAPAVAAAAALIGAAALLWPLVTGDEVSAPRKIVTETAEVAIPARHNDRAYAPRPFDGVAGVAAPAAGPGMPARGARIVRADAPGPDFALLFAPPRRAGGAAPPETEVAAGADPTPPELSVAAARVAGPDARLADILALNRAPSPLLGPLAAQPAPFFGAPPPDRAAKAPEPLTRFTTLPGGAAPVAPDFAHDGFAPDLAEHPPQPEVASAPAPEGVIDAPNAPTSSGDPPYRAAIGAAAEAAAHSEEPAIVASASAEPNEPAPALSTEPPPIVPIPRPAAETPAQVEADTDYPGAVARAPAPRARPRSVVETKFAASSAPTPRARPPSIKPRPHAVETDVAGYLSSPVRGVPSTPVIARAATTHTSADLNGASLLGVFGKPDSRRAILRMADGEVRRVATGQIVEGWKIVRIEATSMRMSRDGETRNLRLVR